MSATGQAGFRRVIDSRLTSIREAGGAIDWGIAMQLSQITTQPPVVSKYGNVTFLLWRGAEFGVVLTGDGRPGPFTGPFSRAEVEDAIAPYARRM
ncbi:hypothetical protein SAMN04244550_03625 [Rhodobacter capsulatus]|uniref:Uncharacterized protein n=2 Tax=Rhodobacter capsulatus TaxID=1061 RepID=A0A1G7SJ68_RHOCA|nr:hypothetical protein SAMN04244550_03625 [Rhodobacter capsulatus]